MSKVVSVVFFVFYSIFTFAQTDYSDLGNWYFHPDKLINFIEEFDLDIAVVSSDLLVDSIISIDNNSAFNTGIDVFWVHPTQLEDAPAFPTSVPLEEQPYALISSTILAQGGLLAKYGRFYAPRYRQASPASFLDASYSDQERANALITTYNDVKAAFENYLINHNNGNRIILAGHSQGSFLLAMLLRDYFDEDDALKDRLVTASLGGMAYVYAEKGLYAGGQWESIPLCTELNQCGCVHNWRSFKETQDIPGVVFETLPLFNSVLVDSGLVYRNVNLDTDWFVQDSVFYSSESSPLRYYIVPDAGYELGGDANFIAFDDFYTVRFNRESETSLALTVDYSNDDEDQRPNDLLPLESSVTYAISGFHVKDYHIYLWALLEQIDAKLAGCSDPVSVDMERVAEGSFKVFPNPSSGIVLVQLDRNRTSSELLEVYDMQGKRILLKSLEENQEIELVKAGVYFFRVGMEYKKVIVQ